MVMQQWALAACCLLAALHSCCICNPLAEQVRLGEFGLGGEAHGIAASCTPFWQSLRVLPCVADAAVLACSTPAASLWGPVWSAMLKFMPCKGCWPLARVPCPYTPTEMPCPF